MNKKDFVKTVADKTQITAKLAESVFDAIIEETLELLKAGEEVNFPGLGHFRPKNLKEAIKRNPKTGEKIKVPAKKTASFKMSKTVVF